MKNENEESDATTKNAPVEAVGPDGAGGGGGGDQLVLVQAICAMAV